MFGQGHIAYQLPDSAIPAASYMLTVHNRPGWHIPGIPEEQHEESAMVVQAGGDGWKWATFSSREVMNPATTLCNPSSPQLMRILFLMHESHIFLLVG